MDESDQRGLYRPSDEHDACGVGFVAHIKGAKNHAIVTQALEILKNIDHRGAVGADPLLGDGAGILIQLPDTLFRNWASGRCLSASQPGIYQRGRGGDSAPARRVSRSSAN